MLDKVKGAVCTTFIQSNHKMALYAIRPKDFGENGIRFVV